MSRLTGPHEAERLVYLTAGANAGKALAAGLTVPLWANQAMTTPADVLAIGGTTIPGNPPTLTVGADSLIPKFQFPNVPNPVVYTKIGTGPVTALHPDADSETAAFGTLVAAAHQTAAGRNLTGLALQAKGGAIGTAGKPVVSIRFDHHLTPLKNTIWPLMVARGLPASVGVVSRWPTGDTFSTGTTWADLIAMTKQGLEVWCHSATHADATSLAALVDEIVTSKAEIESHGIKVQGWQVPGTGTPTYADWRLDSAAAFYGPVGQLIAQNYGFSEGEYPTTVFRQLPHRQYHGLAHTTIETLSLATIKNTVTQAILYGCGIQLMLHPGYIGTGGYLSLVDLTAFLDWLVTQRDAGACEVLTPTGLIAADPGSSRRANVFGNPSFDPTYSDLWTGWSHPNGVSLRTTGGHTGANFVQFTTLGTDKLVQSSSVPLYSGMQGSAVRVEAWLRAPSATATGTIRLVDVNTPANYDETRSFTISTLNTWTKVWFNTVLHPATSTLRIELARDPAVAQNIDFDDITVTPV